ncbi:MAG: ribosome-associated translation inhibitor RaiA [Mollicutes bacterium]|nr:ribosome-associated translation inhibitor RaiA [Mollicutes bacterium]
MILNIRGDKLEITPAIKSYIEEKIGRLDKYLENPENITANIIARVRGIEQIVEVTIRLKKVILRAEETHKDLYAAIDLVSEKLERQILKNKTRMSRKHNTSLVKDMNINFDLHKIENEEKDEGKIVKRKTIEMKPMSEEEAILQLNLIDHDFFVYKDADTNQICVLYKRKDNNYGVITTE